MNAYLCKLSGMTDGVAVSFAGGLRIRLRRSERRKRTAGGHRAPRQRGEN